MNLFGFPGNRSTDLEIMDDLNCSGEVVKQTLREIDYINQKLGGNRTTLRGLSRLLKIMESQQLLRIVDIGCGGGGMLRYLARWSKKQKIHAEFIGIDANPNIIDFARSESADYSNIQYFTMDIFSEEFKNQTYDVILCTLVLHHFNEKQLEDLIQSFKKQATLGIIINDLHRHWLAYYSIKLLTGIFSKSKMVKYDAPLSVKRGFVKSELEKLFSTTGLTSNTTIKWKWAFRWQLIITPGQPT